MKPVAIFLKSTYERNYEEEFLNKTDVFSKRLQQFLINKKKYFMKLL